MLCPEVWNFKSSTDSVNVYSGCPNLDHCENLINHHYFNHNVSVVLPGSPKIPEDLAKELKNDCDYYKVNLPISQLVEKQFIDLFVKTVPRELVTPSVHPGIKFTGMGAKVSKGEAALLSCSGELSGLSIGTRIDVDNCACITPSGVLVLSLLRETYQKLGVEGTPWANSSVNPERYAVSIDLKKDCFQPRKPNYDRVYKSFSQFVPIRFDFILAWDPPEDKGICPSSLASYLHSKGHDVSLCVPTFSYKTQHNVLVPSLITTEPDELIEWLGAFSLGILKKDTEIADSSLEYLSSYEPPCECENLAQVVMLRWTGFFTSRKISQLFSKLWNYISSEQGDKMPWLALNTIGFSDSPLSWGLKHHSFQTSRDNHYTIFMKPQKHLITFQVTPGMLKNVKKQNKWIYKEQKSEKNVQV